MTIPNEAAGTSPAPDEQAAEEQPRLSYKDALALATRIATQGNHAGALELCVNLLAVDAEQPEVLRLAAAALNALHRLDEAYGYLRRALAYNPFDPVAITMLAGLELHRGNTARARALVRRSLAIAPTLPAARWNNAVIELGYGNWEVGWAEYRWGLVNGMRRARTLGPEVELDQPCRGAAFVWCEQGHGDTIMLWRWLKRFREKYRPTRLIVEVPAGLVELFIDDPVVDELYTFQPGSPAPVGWSQHCSSHDIPHLLSLCHEDVVADWEGPYIQVPPAVQAAQPDWKAQDGLTVGIAWRGNPDHPADSTRSVPDEQIARLFGHDRVAQWVNLNPLQHKGLPNNCYCPDLLNYGATRDVIAHCDLVIACDTSVAHLAGAMGVPVLIMLPHVGDWRWGHPDIWDFETDARDGGREIARWYPSARLYRQHIIGDWGPVIEAVWEELNVAERRAC